MAGVNLLKQLRKDTKNTEVVVEKASKMSFGSSSFENLSSFQKTKLALILAGFFVFYFGRDYFNTSYLPQKLAVVQTELDAVSQKINIANRKRAENDEIAKAAETLHAQIQDVQNKIQRIENIRKQNRDKVVRMVDYIVNKMPEPIWISTLKLESANGSMVELKGYSTNYQNISHYFSRLEGAVFFNNWELVESALEKVKSPSGEEVEASRFELKALVAELM